MKVALVAEGVLKNQTEAHFGNGLTDRRGVPQTYPYPMGQHLRGYFGYVLNDMGSPLGSTWNGSSPVYFKDALVKHDCGGILLPVVVNKRFQNYRCSSCGRTLRYATRVETVINAKINRTTGKASIRRTNCITSKHDFRFKAVLALKTGKDYVEDFIAMVKFAEEEGLWLGKRRHKGMGRFTLDNVKFEYVTLNHVKKRAKKLAENDELTFHFVSDLVSDDFDGDILVKGAKISARFFHPDYESYQDPFCKIIWKERLPSRTVCFLDYKEKPSFGKESVIPAGSMIRVSFKNANDQFYEGLAIAEMLRGVGKRTRFGKGEFRILA